jgi:uncharacterized protein YkwD
LRLPRSRLVPAAALLVLLTFAGTACGDRPTASPVAPVSEVDERVDRDGVFEVSTTTTTTAPPTTTTTAPPAPPPTIQAIRRAPTPPPAPVAPPPPPAAVPDANDEARALQLVNGERAKAGVAPLQVNGGARSVARAWSIHMADSGLAHNPDLSGDLQRAGVSGWRTCGENVGYSRSVDEVHSMFMNSSGHRQNILNPAFSQVGIGVVHAGGRVWVTMDLIGY